MTNSFVMNLILNLVTIPFDMELKYISVNLEKYIFLDS